MGHNRVNQSRRNFIKAAAAAGGLLATGIVNPFNAVIFASEQPYRPYKTVVGIWY
ncbi:MAG: twin-arginine translocation signal domain-containing protein [Bacteroidales bacterium]